MVLGKFFSFNLTFKKRLRFKGSWIFFGWVKSSGVQEEVAASYFWLVWVLITGDASPLAWRGNCWSKRQPSWRVAENQYCNSKTPLLDTNCKCTNTKLLVEEKIREMILLLLLKGLSPECDSKTMCLLWHHDSSFRTLQFRSLQPILQAEVSHQPVSQKHLKIHDLHF